VCFYFFRSADEQFVADLCIRRIYCPGFQFENAGTPDSDGRDSKWPKIFDEVNHPIRRVEINHVDGKQHPYRMNSAGRSQPDAIVGLPSSLSQQPPQAHRQSIGRSYAKPKERFAIPIEHTQGSLHFVFSLASLLLFTRDAAAKSARPRISQ
jgi:hypothetical protein